jgi:DNA-binding ferritin-like protein
MKIMKNVNELVEKTLFDVNVNEIENCKEKMKNIINELNSLIENTDFKINFTEFNSDKNSEDVFITLVKTSSKE